MHMIVDLVSMEQEFKRLEKQWKKETIDYPDVLAISEHPAYQRIIEMGPGVVPFIMESMKEEPDNWFIALYILTNDNPVPTRYTGKIQKMTDRWLEYGREQGFIK